MKRILFSIMCISLIPAAFADMNTPDVNAQLIQAANPSVKLVNPQYGRATVQGEDSSYYYFKARIETSADANLIFKMNNCVLTGKDGKKYSDYWIYLAGWCQGLEEKKIAPVSMKTLNVTEETESKPTSKWNTSKLDNEKGAIAYRIPKDGFAELYFLWPVPKDFEPERVILTGLVDLALSKMKNHEKSEPLSSEVKTSESFIQAYKEAHAKRDAKAMAKLVYWEGVPEMWRVFWKAECAETFAFGYHIKEIELKNSADSFKGREFNLPCTHTLAVTHEIDEAVPGGRKTGTKTVESPVGKKGDEFFIVIPKQATSEPSPSKPMINDSFKDANDCHKNALSQTAAGDSMQCSIYYTENVRANSANLMTPPCPAVSRLSLDGLKSVDHTVVWRGVSMTSFLYGLGPSMPHAQDRLCVVRSIGRDYSIGLCDVNGDNWEQLSSPEEGSKDHTPLVSPDGRWIAFIRTPQELKGSFSGNLFLIDVSTKANWNCGEAEPLTPQAWSPDSSALVFSKPDGQAIWKLCVTNRKTEKLISMSGCHEPVWAPNGLQVAFLASNTLVPLPERPFPAGDICTYDVSSGKSSIFSRGWYHSLLWSPDSTKIAFLSIYMHMTTTNEMKTKSGSSGSDANAVSVQFVDNSQVLTVPPANMKLDVRVGICMYRRPMAWLPDSQTLIIVGKNEPSPSELTLPPMTSVKPDATIGFSASVLALRINAEKPCTVLRSTETYDGASMVCRSSMSSFPQNTTQTNAASAEQPAPGEQNPKGGTHGPISSAGEQPRKIGMGPVWTEIVLEFYPSPGDEEVVKRAMESYISVAKQNNLRELSDQEYMGWGQFHDYGKDSDVSFSAKITDVRARFGAPDQIVKEKVDNIGHRNDWYYYGPIALLTDPDQTQIKFVSAPVGFWRYGIRRKAQEAIQTLSVPAPSGKTATSIITSGKRKSQLVAHLAKMGEGVQTSDLIRGTAGSPDKIGILNKCVDVNEVVSKFGKPDRIDKDEMEFYPTKQTGLGLFLDEGERWVYGQITLFVKDNMVSQFGEWNDSIPAKESEIGLTQPKEPENTFGEKTKKLLPEFTEQLQGSNPVRVRNPNNFVVSVGLRSGDKGINFDVSAEGVQTVYVPDGRYDIYFVYSDKPDAMFQGDSFTLNNNGVEIQIVQIVNGNYNIRQVK